MLIAPGTVPYGEWHSSVSRPSLYIVMPLPVDLRTAGGVGKVELFMVTGPGLEDSGVSLAGMGGGAGATWSWGLCRWLWSLPQCGY